MSFWKEFASEKVIYGINTGFGPMAQWRVDDKYLTDLQYNIIRSHSTGAGEPLEDIYVKAAMIARLGTFLQARSGVHPDLVKLLVEMIDRDIFPFIPQHGSVGASGDLVQLAHMALCMIGEGKVHYKGEWRPSAEVLRENGLEPFKIHIREAAVNLQRHVLYDWNRHCQPDLRRQASGLGDVGFGYDERDSLFV